MGVRNASQSNATGTIVSELSREIVQFHARLCGRGPTKARSHVQGDFAMCALEDIFTVAERTLIDSGAGALVQESRQALLAATHDDLVDLVERVSSRPLRLLVSHVDAEADFCLIVGFFERNGD